MLLLLLPLLWEGSLCQRLEVPPSVTVQEGMCAQVPCTFNTDELRLYYHESIYGFWFREGSDISRNLPVAASERNLRVEPQAQGRFHLIGNTKMNNCSLRITDARFTDRGRYFFVVRGSYRHSYRNQQLYVNVTDFIQRPDISIPEMLELGKPVTLNCTFPWACGENRPLKFSWMGAALSSKPQISEASSSSMLSFIPQHHHHGANLTCHVTFPGSSLSSERTVQLHVSYAVQNVTITMALDNRTTVFDPGNSSALVVQEGRSLHLLCAANSNPPATLSWILGDQTLLSSKPSEDGVLHLDLPHLGPADGGNYTCLVQHPLGSKDVSLSISVQYSPRIISRSCLWLKEGLSCTCSIQAEPAPSLLWSVEGKPVELNSSSDTSQVTLISSGPWANSSLRVKVDGVPNITVSCEGKNPHGTRTLLFQLLPDRPMPSHMSPKNMILGILFGAGATSLLALCLLLLLKMLRKKSVVAAAEATMEEVEDETRPSCIDLYPISPAADTALAPVAPGNAAPDELHYACLNFEEAKARENHGSTDPLTEYSEIKFQ
ncbi:sialic acid-binding Ig-like lectin 13 [Notamacropus eugenii]|uniref:sialic acid-binding Ig-like lectin 13 n=1 Tax=Notamacropus eugenii TaxID=9315 RepID=UPI003B66EAE1